jgi:endoglucanase
MPAIWDKYFGFTLEQGYTLGIGEFGGKYGHDDQYGLANPKDVTWQNKIIDYFIEKKVCNFFYWSLNPDSSDTGGIFQPDWINVRTDKLTNLQRLMTACTANTSPVVETTPISDWSFKKYRTNTAPYLVGKLVR